VREHSRLELQRKLAARGHDRAAIGEALAGLAGRGLLSEARMAEAYVAERLRKGFGPVRIRHELRERGIPDALIDPHLEQSALEWLALIAAVSDKKFGPGPGGDRKELARRARFLEYRGFPAELIGRFLYGDNAD
jgi:regulatory protein